MFWVCVCCKQASVVWSDSDPMERDDELEHAWRYDTEAEAYKAMDEWNADMRDLRDW